VQPLPPRAPVAPAAEEPLAEEAAPAPTRRTARPSTPSRATRAPARAPETAAAAPVTETSAATAAPVTATPEPVPAPAAAVPPAPAAPAAATPVAATETADANSEAPWVFGIGALALLGLLGYVFSRRRRARDTDEYVEEAYVEEAVVEEPIAAEPLAPEPVAAAPAALAAQEAVAAPPVSARPWIELGLRPVRAGGSGDDAQVEIELLIDNPSEVAAHDIRVSTWMLPPGDEQSDNERSLIQPPAGSQIAAMDLPPGNQQTVGAILSVRKEAIGGTSAFRPIVVADARYPLPNGGEGRISASFEIGARSGGNTLAPIDVENAAQLGSIEARLHGPLERA
jgi:MYXO-CTERM domain-containing protein